MKTLIRLLLEEQSDLGLHCLPRPICPKTWDHYGKTFYYEEMPQMEQQTVKTLIRGWLFEINDVVS